MAVLIDSSVIIGLLIESDANHNRAKTLFQSFMNNAMGRLYITDFVLDEVITKVWSQLKDKNIVETIYETLMGKKSIFSLLITEFSHLQKTWDKWEKFAEQPKRPLSFTDASLLVIAEEYSIRHIATFDAEFSGLISVLQ